MDSVLDAIEISVDAVNTAVDSTNTLLTTIDGKVTACNTGAVVVSSGTLSAVTTITNPVLTKPASSDSTISTATSASAVNLSASPVRLDSCIFGNATGGGLYMKLYNEAFATTDENDTPVLVIYVPATSSVQYTPTRPIAFSVAISVRSVQESTDGGTTSVTGYAFAQMSTL